MKIKEINISPRSEAGSRLVRFRSVLILLVICGFSALQFVASEDFPDPAIANAEEHSLVVTEAMPPVANPARFQHSTQQHSRMPCLVCHVRSDNRSTPKMPGHVPCSSCHVQEFSGNTSPMCTICHTATGLKPFPGLKTFNAVFDHGQHLRETNCATCHKPAARGVALSIPARISAHTTCFQCHSPGKTVGGRNIDSCSTCHKPGRLVRTSQNAPAFSKNFSHAEHRVKGMNCSECHTVLARMPRGRQVTSPTASMHFARPNTSSCATCHNGRRAFGGDNFGDCRKCHEGRTFRF